MPTEWQIQANKLAGQLADLAGLADTEATASFPQIQADFANLSKLLGVAPRAAAAPGQAATDFSTFFQSVGSALVTAQKQLDIASAGYLQGLDGGTGPGKPGCALPAVFRIPKVSADIKFALQDVTGKDVNLIFFSSKEEATAQHQQSVQFDILAVPPPQGAAGLLPLEQVKAAESALDGTQGLLALQRLVEPAARATLLNALKQVFIADAAKRRSLAVDTLAENFDHVLVYSLEDKRYFLVYAEPGSSKNLGVWYLNLVGPEPDLQPVYKYTRAPAPGEVVGPLQELVIALGQAQAAALSG